MFRVNIVFFLSSFIYLLIYLFFFFCNKQDITLISQHFIIIQSDQNLCPLKINRYYRIHE